ncbi:MAG: VOC family protein [Proteobacteria bacterium]|nr:VOC family protein [Pseudomonadota bacterium]
MAEIVAPEGSPLSVAVLGTGDLEASLRLYRDMIGLDVVERRTWHGPDFERHWHLPPGSSAEAVFLQAGKTEVGRILLLDCSANERKIVRAGKESWHYGLSNLNFYTADIHAAAKEFASAGFEFWSEPKAHAMTPEVGTPIEVVFEGPDGVLINLVELATTDPKTRIGQMRAFVDEHGRTRTGFTPVVTTNHVLQSRELGKRFYEEVLSMRPLIDEELSSAEARHFLRLGENRIWTMFMQGNHMFGKIATSTPIDFSPPNTTPRAVPPNQGYLAQTFVVTDFEKAKAKCNELAVAEFTPEMEIDLPGFGTRRTMVVRNPGSGALQEIVAAT